MTPEDENAAIGRMVSRFSEAKKRRAALLNEGHKFGQLLDDAATKLKTLNYVDAFWGGGQSGYARNRSDIVIQPYPELSRITQLVEELREVSAEVRQLRGLLKDAGLSVE